MSAGAARRPTVVIVDDHAVVCEGIRALLESEFDVVGTTTDPGAASALVRRHAPDVVVLDIAMPGISGIQLAHALRVHHPASRVVMLSMHSEPHHVTEAIQAGARAFVPKLAPGAELRHAIREALANRVYVSPELRRAPARGPGGGAKMLTRRQRQVLALIVQGRTAPQIAETLGIATKTAEFHRDAVKRALGIRSNAELVRYALTHGLVQ